eukprot:TRINITY_DN2341_c0_g1_i1.p1 TRINITY_DN2341_c0_g1~~TRINITY_DN2341_c0_g1_i1.p1  ORF type:complete len:357 (+),score=66.49 TRINITY_DN2341_c0_g1_i1:76-1146(+)
MVVYALLELRLVLAISAISFELLLLIGLLLSRTDLLGRLLPKYEVELKNPMYLCQLANIVLSIAAMSCSVVFLTMDSSAESNILRCDIMARACVVFSVAASTAVYAFLIFRTKVSGVFASPKIQFITKQAVLSTVTSPIFMVILAVFTHGVFLPIESSQGSSIHGTQYVCDILIQPWWLAILFSVLDWCLEMLFLALFLVPLLELLNNKNNAGSPSGVATPEAGARRGQIISAAKKNLRVTAVSVFVTSFGTIMIGIADATTRTDLVVSFGLFSYVYMVTNSICLVWATSSAFTSRWNKVDSTGSGPNRKNTVGNTSDNNRRTPIQGSGVSAGSMQVEVLPMKAEDAHQQTESSVN